MTWSDFRLYAAEAPDAGGVMITAPFVVDGALRVFRIVDATAVEPALSSALAAAEIDAAVRNGAWRRVPDGEAQRGFLTIVLGRAFARALRSAYVTDDLSWTDLGYGWMFGYAATDTAAAWVSSCANQLLAWGRTNFEAYLKNSSPSLDFIEGVAHHVISVTQEGSEERQQAYLLLGAISTHLGPLGLGVLAELAESEFGMTPLAFEGKVEQLLKACNQEREPIMGTESWEASLNPIMYADECNVG